MSTEVTFADIVKAAMVLDLSVLQNLCDESNALGVPLKELMAQRGVLLPEILESLSLGHTLVQDGKISVTQFSVAMFDQVCTSILMTESLRVRGWLPPG